jgi:hypothetical protein
VRAGLTLVAGISELMANGDHLNARVGIATGIVVVGDLLGVGEAQEREIAGETPIQQPGCRIWPTPARWSSPPIRDGFSATCSSSPR